MRQKRTKFLRDVARSNMKEDSVWEEYVEEVVNQRIISERKKVDDLTKAEKKQYSVQIVAAEAAYKLDINKKNLYGNNIIEKDVYISIPKLQPSIKIKLKEGCGKFIYRQLKKMTKRKQFNIKLPARNIGKLINN